ncbi:MAG TPA: hypothetical protein VGM53_14910 [Streptosporangiaceae bacterium]|jgi:hypothetical protein
MPFRFPSRLASVLASVLAAGFTLTVAGCSGQITPLGPYAPPKPHHLAAPLVLQAVRIQPATPAGRCPAGSAVLSAPAGSSTPAAGPGHCYRKLGTPLTITSAAVAAATLTPSRANASTGQAAGASSYGFVIAPPASDAAALTAITTTAAGAHGNLALSVAGRTWLLPRVVRPFTHQFQIMLPRNQARWLRRVLIPAG